MTAVASYAAALAITVLALGAPGCGKRASGSCREDVDCPPGFDCVSSACARRERLSFAGAGGTPVALPQEVPFVRAPHPVEVLPPAPPVPKPPVVKPKATPRPDQPAVPAAPVPEQRLPAWKQRLKNT